MKLLFTGGTFCDYPTLLRLLLLGTEVGFTDRPSVTYGQWGTIGINSPLRGLAPLDGPVTIQVHSPPTGKPAQMYQAYIEADLRNDAFKNAFINGLKQSKKFSAKFIQPSAKYSEKLTGVQVREGLLRGVDQIAINSDPQISPQTLFNVATAEGRRDTLKVLVGEASIQVTTALMMAEQTGSLPVSDDPHFLRLLALRTTQSDYLGSPLGLSPFLGIEFAKAVLPDELLSQLDAEAVLAYRRKTKDAYEAWTVELDRIAVEAENVDSTNAERLIPQLVAAHLAPQAVSLRNELVSARDDMFGDLIKKVVSWRFPALTAAYLAGGYGAGLEAFAALAVPGIAASIVDFVKANRQAKRKHAVSYLVGLRG